MSNSKERFLKTEFFIFSWKAAAEHNLVWNKNTTDKAKGNFRKNIKEFLEDKLSKVYGKRKVTEEEHIKNILVLIEETLTSPNLKVDTRQFLTMAFLLLLTDLLMTILCIFLIQMISVFMNFATGNGLKGKTEEF